MLGLVGGGYKVTSFEPNLSTELLQLPVHLCGRTTPGRAPLACSSGGLSLAGSVSVGCIQYQR